MKPLFAVAAAAIVIAACDGATAPRSAQSRVDDSRVPAGLRAAYREDAARMALRDLQARGYKDIPIPDESVQPYYDGLVAVYNATVLPARDTVVDVFDIHTFGNPPTRGVYLWALLSEPWVERLSRGEIPTGNPDVDAILARYGLSFTGAHILYEGDVLITLQSPEARNMDALAPLFRGFAGVKYSEPNVMGGDGNDIEGTVDRSRVVLAYSVGTGDCPAGCIHRRYYRFAVEPDGMVEYLGASGTIEQ
jgi:hypothetical protein